MNIIVRGTILYFTYFYPKARTSLLLWYYEFSKQAFANFNDLKSVYGNASMTADDEVVFNIKGDEYKMIVCVNFRQLAAQVVWFGTQNEYDGMQD